MSAEWRKSSHSYVEENSCVEVAGMASGIGVRDSKAPQAGHLALDISDWRNMLETIKTGRLDLPR
jgi:hypothetical protein